eukprot:TRINITY_DN65212_c0_g1_i1.p1 TRINITY_DN65212_c0_g1~~TRINITY_DN65212_c0_g1_i1.p1  ORF type:complete len:139 (-),score=8.54 TRINITY_DN65212_c0_g1_i1:149-565(-)
MSTITIGKLELVRELYHNSVKKRLKQYCANWIRGNTVGDNPDFWLGLDGEIKCSRPDANDWQGTGLKWTDDRQLWYAPEELETDTTPYAQIKGKMLKALEVQCLARVIKELWPGYAEDESELSSTLSRTSSLASEIED